MHYKLLHNDFFAENARRRRVGVFAPNIIIHLHCVYKYFLHRGGVLNEKV